MKTIKRYSEKRLYNPSGLEPELKHSVKCARNVEWDGCFCSARNKMAEKLNPNKLLQNPLWAGSTIEYGYGAMTLIHPNGTGRMTLKIGGQS